MNFGTFGLAALAGLLTTLSPCVLPVLPLVLASSLKDGRRGPLDFVSGLLLTFVGATWALSSFGTVFGLDRAFIRVFSGAILMASGILFLSINAQELLSKLLAPLLQRVQATSSSRPDRGQFALGALTGLIWTPCSGPSLGIAIGLAADRKDALSSLLLLFVFGLGAALPILLIAYGSASLTARLKRVSLGSADLVKKIAGVFILFFGLAIVSGFDKQIEAFLVRVSPDFLTDLTTRF